MSFDSNEEQQLLNDSIGRYLGDHYSFEQRRANVADAAPFSAECWRDFAELGWLGLPFAEADGGFGGGAVELAGLFEAFGRHLVVEPYLENIVLAGGALRRAASAEQRRRWLAPLMAGELQAALAHFEAAGLETRAEPEGEGYRLNGSKAVVYNAPAAQLLVVSARLHSAVALFAVPADSPGLGRREYPTIDGRSAADIALDDVHLGRDALLSEAEAEGVLAVVLDEALLVVCAEAVGAMDALLTATVDYCKERRQFGSPIGRFQVLQHRMVDMYLACESARSLLPVCAAKLQSGAADARRYIAALKVKVDDAARFVGQSAIQLHGGIAMTDELSVGHYFKRLTVLSQLFGSSDEHLQRYNSLTH